MTAASARRSTRQSRRGRSRCGRARGCRRRGDGSRSRATITSAKSSDRAEQRRQPRAAQRAAERRLTAAAPREPAPAVLPALADAQAGGRGRPVDRVDADARPAEPAARERPCSSRSRARPTRAPGGSHSTSTVPPGASSAATRRSSPAGPPPMPMLPSSSSAQRHVPAPGTCRRSTPRARRAAPRGRARPRPARRRRRAASTPRRASAWTWRPGPAADVEHRPARAGEHPLVGGGDGAEPALERQGVRPCHPCRGRAVRRRRSAPPRRAPRPRSCRREHAREARFGDQRRDRVRVGDHVDVAQRRQRGHPQALLTQPRELARAGVRRGSSARP